MITHPVQSGWKNWNSISEFLCGRRINLKKKVQEKKLDVAEMRMFILTCGITRLDRIRNERITGTNIQESAGKVCPSEADM